MTGKGSHHRRLEAALALLCEEIRERVSHHPWGHLVEGRAASLDVHLDLPVQARGGRLDALAAEIDRAIEEALGATLAHFATFRPGRAFCLRCGSADCDHALPPEPRAVFTGYGPSGLPRFRDFAQYLLETKDPQLDRLWREPPGLVTHVAGGAELTSDLLPAYADARGGYRLHGQVTAGWYRVPDPSGRPHALAITLQVVSTRAPRSRRRFGLNVLGRGPAGEPLENLYDRLGTIPWSDTVRWGQAALRGIERAAAARGGRDQGVQGNVERRLDGLLGGLARRLDKRRRARDRRTRHAEKRRDEGDRPIDMALRDLARAADGDILLDTRRDTLVVLGDRGRAHVFNGDGKLVTSIRYNPAAIERRRQLGLWRPAGADRARALRERVAAGEGRGG